MESNTSLLAELSALTEGVPHRIANLANASALLFGKLPDLNWAGFYLLEGDRLILGPFQGKPACIEIPMGRGVCGSAAMLGKTLCVPNVHDFPGHIACDAASASEIVVPMYVNGALLGVLDIDSPTRNRFTPEDVSLLEEFVRILERTLSK